MRFIGIVFILLCASLVARENPFQAVATSGTTGKATYKKDNIKNFNSVKMQLPSSARILKSVEFHFQNLDGSLESKTIKIGDKIDWHDELVVKKLYDEIATPVVLASTAVKKRTKNINFKNIVLFTIDGKSLHVKTKDRKIRDFLVTSPSKIVIDFQREIAFYTKVYSLKTKYFKSITLGKHNGYYRVAVELDGKYLYDKQKTEDGYTFTLR